MANLTQVLNGNRLYGSVTYEENYDPQTLTASFGETQGSADADLFRVQKPLADTQASSDAIAKLIQRTLADTQSSTEAKVATILKALTESQGSSDALVLAGGKSLAELLALSETWAVQAAKALSDSSSMTESFAKSVRTAFGDTASSSDAMSISGLKTFLESVSASETTVKTVQKIFTEITTSSPNLYSRTMYGSHQYSSDMIDPAIYMLEELTRQIKKIFTESLSIADSSVVIHQLKGFSDFIVLQEWFQIQLKRADIWAATSGSAVVESHFILYGFQQYGVKLYSANPTVNWATPAGDTSVWNKPADVVTEQTLYAQSLYGRPLNSAEPTVEWAASSSSGQAWTNSDGQNNQEA